MDLIIPYLVTFNITSDIIIISREVCLYFYTPLHGYNVHTGESEKHSIPASFSHSLYDLGCRQTLFSDSCCASWRYYTHSSTPSYSSLSINGLCPSGTVTQVSPNHFHMVFILTCLTAWNVHFISLSFRRTGSNEKMLFGTL